MRVDFFVLFFGVKIVKLCDITLIYIFFYNSNILKNPTIRQTFLYLIHNFITHILYIILK